ncbi:MAG TPA: hypothetical protein VN622_09285 [Clostridia bacterium]|nr:hypothetical protein [Clostridia bacterium]
MAKPLPDWEDRDFAPSTLPENGELTYPEPVAQEAVMPPALPGTPPAYQAQDRALPGSRSSSRLNSAAESIGGTLGLVRKLPRKMKSRLRIVGGRDSAAGVARGPGESAPEWEDAAVETLKEAATGTMVEVRETAAQRLRQWSVVTRRQVLNARRRAAYYADNYPVQTISAFTGLAFCAGFVLRVWRSNSD